MAAEFIRHGDSVAAIIDILQNYTPEFLPFGEVRISGDLVGWTPEDRWVMVSREGGLKRWPFKVDKPRIDITVYARKSTTAFDIASIAEASIFRARGTYSGYGVRLMFAEEEVGLTEVYDKHQESPAIFLSLRLTTTPDSNSMPTAS